MLNIPSEYLISQASLLYKEKYLGQMIADREQVTGGS